MASDEHSCQRIGDALRWAIRLLAIRQLETPRLDAEVFLAHTLSVERPQIYVRSNECLTPEETARFTELIHRRAQNEPVAYLIGTRAFYDVTLEVSPAVLIPRPETEHLVEHGLAWAQKQDKEKLFVVDVGTGSGALAVVLGRHLPQGRVWAVDLSMDALRVARQNIQRYDLTERVQLVQADLLQPLVGPFDLVVANLPYIDPQILLHLEPNVVDYEPHLALDGGLGGIDIIKRLLAQLPSRLARPGLALFEIDPDQATESRSLAQQKLPDARIDILKDYAGNARVLCIARDEKVNHAGK